MSREPAHKGGPGARGGGGGRPVSCDPEGSLRLQEKDGPSGERMFPGSTLGDHWIGQGLRHS